MNETKILKEMPRSIAGQTYRDLRAALSTTELNALDVICSEINKKNLKEVAAPSNNVYEIKAKDYLDKFTKYTKKEPMSEESVYKHLTNGIKALYKYSIEPVTGEEGLSIRIIDTISLDKEKKNISLILSPAMQLILKTQQEKNKEESTEDVTLAFKNAYAKKLYPMLLPHRDKEKRKDDIESLKRKLGISENIKTSQIMSYIEKAVNEINKASDIHVKIKPERKEKDITGVTFTVLTKIDKAKSNKAKEVKENEQSKKV